MTFPLDRTRPRLTQPARRVASRALRLVTAAAWRTLHPSAREPFVEAPRPRPLPRLHVETRDGWVFPLFRVAPCPCGSGEPVLLLHSVASSAQGFAYGADNLATALAAAGYHVFLATHRGDREARHADGASPSLDGVACIDVPAALDAVCAYTGAQALHVVGFGLGALLGLDVGARRPEQVASVTALAPPLRLAPARTELRAAQVALELLPATLSLPVRTLTRAALPLIEGETCPGERLRGSLAYTTDDVSLGLVRRLLDWVREGRPSLVPGVDLETCLGQADAPLHIVLGEADSVALPSSADAAVAAWSGPSEVTWVPGYGHIDLLYGRDVATAVHQPVLRWLSVHRGRSWGAVESVA